MAPTYEKLQAMTDEEVMAKFDGGAGNTALGLGFWRDEITRRYTDRQTQNMVDLTNTMKNLMWATFAFTVVAAGASIGALIVAITSGD